MKHDREVVAAFEEAFTPKEGEEVVQEVVDEACEAVFAKAAEQFGPEGLYVHGILNPDMGGVSFRFKRPGIRQRVEHFIECNVPKPPRKEEAQDDEDSDDAQDNASNDDDNNPGSSDARLQRLIALSEDLGDDDFTKDGKPEVNALNDLLEEGEEEFTAAERDELWKQVPEA